jgi:hypothetical protein
VLTQDDLLRVIERSYPADYLFAIRQKLNGGYELFAAAAAVSARVALAVARFYCCSFIATAHGGAKALANIEFYRDSALAGAVNILNGTVVTTADGRDFVVLAPISFLAADLGPHVTVAEAVAVGEEYNVPGQVTTAGGEVLPGEISIIKRLVTGPAVLDPEMRVRQLVDAEGGKSACLDGLGADLNVPRQTGESDPAYRVRIRATPDTVSPKALQRTLDKLLAPYGGGLCLREVGTSKLPGFFCDAGSSADTPQRPENNYACDMDPTVRPQDRFKLVMSNAESRGFMLVGVPVIPGGAAVYRAVFAAVDAKRVGGVGFDLYQETIGCF